MPKLSIEHTENHNDIIQTIEILGKLLPPNYRTLVLDINDKQTTFKIATSLLREQLPSNQISEKFPTSWAAYDEPVTQDMLVELARSWSETSKSFTESVRRADRDISLHWRIDRAKVPIKNQIYRGHISHPKIRNHFNKGRLKASRFLNYACERLALATPTPEDWLPPDLR